MDVSFLYRQKYLVFGVIFIIVLCVVFLIYYFTKSKNIKTTAIDNNNGSDKQAELMLFYVDWCPHCKTAKPVWEDLKAEYQDKTIDGYYILFTEVNCTEETSEIEKLIKKYNIEGYPTIKLIKDGQIIDFDSKVSKDTLTEFLNTAL